MEDRIFPVEEDSEKEAYVSVRKREAAKTSTKRDKKGKSKSDGKRSERDSDEHNSYGTLNELFRNQPSKRNVDHGDSSDPSSSSSDSSSSSSDTKSSKSRHKHGKYKKKKSTEKPTAMDRFAKIARTVTNGVYMTHQQPSFEHIVLKACNVPSCMIFIDQIHSYISRNSVLLSAPSLVTDKAREEIINRNHGYVDEANFHTLSLKDFITALQRATGPLTKKEFQDNMEKYAIFRIRPEYVFSPINFEPLWTHCPNTEETLSTSLTSWLATTSLSYLSAIARKEA
jgi:hypothetical protein